MTRAASVVDTDRAAILEVHRGWWESNRELDAQAMRPCIAGDDRFYQFNLTGHPYYSVDELTALWQALNAVPVRIPDIGADENLRLEIRGDMAWLACENVIRLEVPEGVDLGPLPTDPFRVRSTEVYQREPDGTWTIWHMHVSPAAAPSEPRLPAGDTYETRAAPVG